MQIEKKLIRLCGCAGLAICIYSDSFVSLGLQRISTKRMNADSSEIFRANTGYPNSWYGDFFFFFFFALCDPVIKNLEI